MDICTTVLFKHTKSLGIYRDNFTIIEHGRIKIYQDVFWECYIANEAGYFVKNNLKKFQKKNHENLQN